MFIEGKLLNKFCVTFYFKDEYFFNQKRERENEREWERENKSGEKKKWKHVFKTRKGIFASSQEKKEANLHLSAHLINDKEQYM